jgi:hypothetical protein
MDEISIVRISRHKITYWIMTVDFKQELFFPGWHLLFYANNATTSLCSQFFILKMFTFMTPSGVMARDSGRILSLSPLDSLWRTDTLSVALDSLCVDREVSLSVSEVDREVSLSVTD